MKFGKYFESNKHPAFAQGAVEYSYMKKKLKEIVAAKGTSAVSMPPTGVASKTHPDFSAADVSTMMREWARLLEEELQKVEAFTSAKVAELQASVSLLSRRCGTGTGSDVPALTVEADALANTVIELDKFTRINALALEKIVKKHDKMLQMSTRLWLLARLEAAGFTNVKLDGFLVALSDIYSRLRDLASPADEDKKGVWVPPESFERTTTKFWIRLEDVIRLKCLITKHLPVLVFGRDTSRYKEVSPLEKEKLLEATDSGHISSIYLDSDDLSCYAARIRREEGARLFRLRWYGPAAIPSDKTEVFVERKTHHEKWVADTSVKERFSVKASKVVPFMSGAFDVVAALDRKVADGELSSGSAEKLKQLARECQDEIVTRRLSARVRTRYKRAAYQHATDNAVRVSLDTELQLFNEAQYESWRPGQWCCDSKQMGAPGACLNFPYAVLEIKLQDPTNPPAWVSELLTTGIGTPVWKSSKYLSGAYYFFPERTGGVMPHWFRDDGTLEVVSTYRTAARRSLMLFAQPVPPELALRPGENPEEADEDVRKTSAAAANYYRVAKARTAAASASGAAEGGAGAGAAVGGAGAPSTTPATAAAASSAGAGGIGSGIPGLDIRVRSQSGRLVSGPLALKAAGAGAGGADMELTDRSTSGTPPSGVGPDALAIAMSGPSVGSAASGGISSLNATRGAIARSVSFAAGAKGSSSRDLLSEPLLGGGSPGAKAAAATAGAGVSSAGWWASVFARNKPAGGAHDGYTALPASSSGGMVGVGRPGPSGAPPAVPVAPGGAAAAEGNKTVNGLPWSVWRDFVLDIFGQYTPPPRARLQPVRVEPKTIFSNERTFLRWLGDVLILVAICFGLLNFGSDAATLAGKILGTASCFFMIYALIRYYMRAFLIRTGAPYGYHDRFGPLAITLLLLVALTINLVETFVTGSEAGKIRATAPVAAYASASAPTPQHLLASTYYGAVDGPSPVAAAAFAGAAAAAAAALAQLGASLPLPRLLRPVGLASSSVGSSLPAVADFRLAVATLPTAAVSDAADSATAAATWRQAPLPVPGLVDVEQLPAAAADSDSTAMNGDLLLLASHYGGLGRWGGSSSSSSSAAVSATGGFAAAAVSPANGAIAGAASASLGRNTLHVWSAAAGKELASVSLDAFIDSRAQGPIRSITLLPASSSGAASSAAEDSTCTDPAGDLAPIAAASSSAMTRVYRVLVATDAALTTVQLTLTLPAQQPADDASSASSAPSAARGSLAALPLASFSVPLDIVAPLPSGVVTVPRVGFGSVAAAAPAPVIGDIALSSSSSSSSTSSETQAEARLDTAHVLFPAEGVVRSFRLPCWQPLAVARLPTPPSAVAAADSAAGAGSGAAVPSLWRGMTAAAAGVDGRSQLLLSETSGAALHEVALP